MRSRISRWRMSLRTSPKSNCSRYRRPPWIRRVGRELVPEPKSSCSTSATDMPRSAASRAMPAPTIPPPMTRRSTVRPPSDRTVSSRAPRATAAWCSDTPADEGSKAARLLVRLVVFVDRVVHLGDSRIQGLLGGGLAEQHRLDHLLRSCARLREDPEDGAVGHPVLWRLTDLVHGRQKLRVLRRPFLARRFVVRRLADGVVPRVRLPLCLRQRAHRVLHELPCGLLLGGRTALHDVERGAADDVAAVLGLVVRTREKAGPHREFRVVDVVTHLRGALDIHRVLARIERVLRTRIVDTGIVEVPAVESGLPPIEDGLARGIVVDDLRDTSVAAVAVVRVELA